MVLPSPARNRVDPFGEIVAVEQRGTFMGNRGALQRAPYEIGRPWQVRRWITCVLSYKDWVAPRWVQGRWTALFFLDEAVALAAGHRPCALCRRADYNRWRSAWVAASGGAGEPPSADEMDLRLHADRLDGRQQRHHTRPWRHLPTGTYVLLDDGSPAAVLADGVAPWTPAGYGPLGARPRSGEATVLTPSVTVDVIAHGYAPALHPDLL
jgi:hypothetical protein